MVLPINNLVIPGTYLMLVVRQTLAFVCGTALISTITINALAQGGLPAEDYGQSDGPPAGGVDNTTYTQQYSYMLGQNFGLGLKQNQIECNIESLVAGITDALSGAQPKYTEAQLEACRQRFEQEMRQKMMGRMQQVAVKNAKEAEQFFAQNKTQAGVQATPSGLQFKVLKQGTGATPTATDQVRCHYRGTLLDGTEFDSSYDGEPAIFGVDQVIPGWTEALQKMKVGDKWQLYVPADLAYGMQPPPGAPIEPNSMLIFDVELLGVEGK